MNSSQVNLTMFNPFDVANFVAGSFVLSMFGLISGTNPLLLLAAPFITGVFMLIAKALEIAYKARADKQKEYWKNRALRAEAHSSTMLEHNQNMVAGRQ